MMFKTHFALGALAGFFLLNYFQPEHAFLFSFVFLFASVLPDIDTTKSIVGKRFLPLSSFLSIFTRHRGFFHSVWIPAISLLAFSYIDYSMIGIAFALGYILHIIMDALSEEGVSMFSPVWKHRFSGFVKTGSVLEYVFLMLACIVFALVYPLIL